MIVSKTQGIFATGKERLDLVNAFGTKARLHAVEWVVSTVQNLEADLRMAFALSVEDYETADVPDNPVDLVDNIHTYNIFSWIHEVVAGGGLTSIIGSFIYDLKRFEIDVVCPITVLRYSSAGNSPIWCKVYYEILRASGNEITDIAARQGLQMEV